LRQTTDARLARVTKAKAPSHLPGARQRSLLRARAAIGGLLHERFRAAFELGDEAAAVLAGIPDTPELREADAASLSRDHAGLEKTFEARLGQLALQCRDGRELNSASASPAELLAAYIAGAGWDGNASEVLG
jgi:hypothetical protein